MNDEMLEKLVQLQEEQEKPKGKINWKHFFTETSAE